MIVCKLQIQNCRDFCLNIPQFDIDRILVRVIRLSGKEWQWQGAKMARLFVQYLAIHSNKRFSIVDSTIFQILGK